MNDGNHDHSPGRSTPTAYQLQAAVLAARVLDEGGNTAPSLAVSYDQLATGGLYRSQDLQAGHRLLQRAHLVTVARGQPRPNPNIARACVGYPTT